MKKIISLLLALIMIFTLCACGGRDDTDETEETNESADPKGISLSAIQTAFEAWAKKTEGVENLTMTFSAETPEGNYSADGKVSVKDRTMLITAPIDTDKYSVAVDGNKVYAMLESENSLPRGSVKELTEDELKKLYGSYTSEELNLDITQEQVEHVLNMFLGNETFDLDYLEEIGITPDVDALIQGFGVTKEMVENIANAIIDVVANEEWLKESFPITYETNGNVTTFSMEVSPLNVMVDVMVAMLKTMGQPVTAEDLLESLESQMGLSDLSVKVDGTVTDGIPTEMTATLTVSEQEYKFDFSISDINNTTVDTASVKDTLTTAHGDYTECQDCGSETLFFRGYCKDCVGAHFCLNFCGNECDGDDGYCSDCRIPCKGGCGRHADYEEGYCYDCYYEIYCYYDCGNEATHFYKYDDTDYSVGYCDECYEEWFGDAYDQTSV